MEKIHMLSGIPRSGSQVLSSMLNQHPLIYSTTTSSLVEFLNTFYNDYKIKTQNQIDIEKNQLKNTAKHLIQGYYCHIDKPIIIDKNRLWPIYGSMMNHILDEPPKIICTVRPIAEVLASYIILIEKNNSKVTYIDEDLKELNLQVNTKNRCKVLWEKYIFHPYTNLRLGFNSSNIDILFCSYDQIVNDSQTTIDRICNFLNIGTFTLDKNNLQKMDENDEFHGGLTGLHEVRSTLKKVSPSAEKVLGQDLAWYYNQMNLEFWKQHVE
jgi:sulfotransferase